MAGSAPTVSASLYELRKRVGHLGRLWIMDDRRANAAGKLARWSSTSSVGRRLASVLGSLVGASAAELDVAAKMHDLLKGRPSDFFVRHAYFKSKDAPGAVVDPARDGVGLLWFAPIAPMKGTSVNDVVEMCRPLFAKHGFDFYVALLVQNARSMVVLTSIFFDKANVREAARASELYAELSRTTSAARLQQYRVGTEGMPTLFDENLPYRSFLRTLQAAIDPARILAPGRYGV